VPAQKCIHGVAEDNCAHCRPGRFLPPIKTRSRWQTHADQKSLDTSDQHKGKSEKPDQREEERLDTEFQSRLRIGLKTLRTDLARELKVSPFIIFTNNALNDMVTSAPTTLEALSNAEGLTNKQISDYGQDILKVVNATLRE